MAGSNESQGKDVLVIGRIVWVGGDLFAGKLQTTFGTKEPKLNREGQQVREWSFGLAVPKTTLSVPAPEGNLDIWNALHEEMYALYPSRAIPAAFAKKYKDGDTELDDKGAPYSQREGYAGCLVFSLSTQMPIKFFRTTNGVHEIINEGIRCGDYVQVQVRVKAHGPIGQGKPGLYMNPNAVLFVGHGKEIQTNRSADQIFGSTPPPLPPGASATPLAPQGGSLLVPPGQPLTMPGFGQPQAAPPPQQQWGAPSPQAASPQPNYGVLPPQYQPQATPPPQQWGAPPPQAAAPWQPPQGVPQMPAAPGWPQS